MNNLRQAAQQALEALEEVRGALVYVGLGNASENPNLAKSTCRQAVWKADRGINALSEALEQPAQSAEIKNQWALRDVYFDEDGEPTMHKSPEQPAQEPIETMRSTLEMIAAAPDLLGALQQAMCDEVEALRQDAQRYRWLRGNCQSESGKCNFSLKLYGHLAFGFDKYKWVDGKPIQVSDLDAALDAAIRARGMK